jgi:hypothetical protein
VAIRSTLTPGSITVTATREGLTPATMKIESEPVEIVGDVGPDGLGRMVWSAKMPARGTPILVPQSSDEFNATSLSPQWEWMWG